VKRLQPGKASVPAILKEVFRWADKLS